MTYNINQRGFTLIELVMVIIIIGILVGIATMKMTSTIDTAKFEATRAEMDGLARAIIGNPDTYTEGAQSDFGYVGDVGALPPNLDALVFNPGYATWDGPYLSGGFDNTDFKKDAWNADFIYGGIYIRSVGSGSNIDKILASGPNELLANTIHGFLLDGNNTPPGDAYIDSVDIDLIFPDGAGGTAHASAALGADGSFDFTGVPIGNHTLRVIYLPANDTVDYDLSIIPGNDAYVTLNFPADLW
jgi:prepilin-type N-terminal cleavage/methylation domain-containing protein